ncbi:hypothetical protein [[Eubacterium] cellulosolvens]
MVYQATNQYSIPTYQERYNKWTSDFTSAFIVGMIFFLIGLISSIIGIGFNIHFPLDYRHVLKSTWENIAVWSLLGVLLIILGLGIIKRSYFSRDKISRAFTRSSLLSNPQPIEDLNSVILALAQALEMNMIQCTKTTPPGLTNKPVTELRLIGKSLSIYIEPIVSLSKYHFGRFLGVTISIGSKPNKDSQEVQQLINLIEHTLNPKEIQQNLYGC